MLITEEELIELISNAGLTALNGDTEQGSIDLATNDIKVLIEYAKSNQIKYLFYHYIYLDEDKYILENFASSIDCFDDLCNVAKKDIAKYKRAVNAIDFGKPAILGLICLHNGAIVTMNVAEPWVVDLETPKNFLRRLKNENLEELVKLKDAHWKEKHEQKEAILKELKGIILSNSEFANCTNQNQRYVFITNLLDNPNNSKYRNVFLSELGLPDMREVRYFIDTLYAEYKRTIGKKPVNQ